MNFHQLINPERLARTFVRLCETDSPSGEEGRMAALVTEMLCGLGAPPPLEDDSAAWTGSQCGNLIFRFDGDIGREPLFFCCHLDTVEPGRGIKVLRQGDRFTSSGSTILGSDDKSGIAALIEAWQVIQEHKLPHAPLEFIFTTCEEVGLLGAKVLNPSHVRAKMGYALDSTGFGRVITGAPASNRLRITVKGAAAHAGLHPEKGINAILLAAKALAAAPCGRIDSETTVNFGTIQGGAATNIVPEQVLIEGEVRSHSMAKLERLTQEIEAAFRRAVADWRDPSGQAQGTPELDFQAELDFPAMKLDMNDAVIRRIAAAAERIDMKLRYETAGGGSDANVFNSCGLATAIVATGMTHVHSTAEEVSLTDMRQLTALILALTA
ncbi:MAG: M20/M25/M40 family metallo-hydrolase [Candidatus Electronema sp. V4]|uniref:M20/M25/M40 family metallo-hydrolase n=1 Tax=Candidatus Electronema sp. V4 TaxID=3454756 RepID=UPI0040556918